MSAVRMNLQDILLPEFIKVNLKADDKTSAFKELVTHYCKTDNSSSYNQILDAIVKREEKMSTGIHKGIAVPHGKTDAVKKLCGALGISEKGVQYDSLDGEPVHLLFMIISPIDDSDNFLWMLKHLAQLIENPQFQAELQLQKDPQSAFNVICKFEDTLSGK
jgi:PTS system fructose-specific IIC component/PTS system nitrogen regulatory IIA component